jgi:hypothetical protein
LANRKLVAVSVLLVVASIVSGFLIAKVNDFINEQRSGDEAIELSKKSPEVQGYLAFHINAECDVMKLYVKRDGNVCTVDKHWELIRYVGHSNEPSDGQDHYCWCVRWHDPTSAISHILNVFIDKDSWKIVLIEEAY